VKYCEIEELSYRQISDITMPIGTVMARARQAFGHAWRREPDGGV
jgi:DNA-directed RNA polymerase specialized sigma24 family protein